MATAIYMRVSTTKQEDEGISLENQKEKLYAYCQFKGLENIKEYLDVGSGRTESRTSYQKMLEDVRSGLLKNVVIYKLDRLNRSVVDLNNFVNVLSENDCTIHSTVENLDTTTASGRMMINLIGVFAQWESETISERVSDNMNTLASRGVWQSSVPYGFYLGDDKRLKIKEDEAEILREAFDLVLNGESFSNAERIINKKYNLDWYGYLRRKARSETTVGNIYRNGKVYENTHDPIIDLKTRDKLLEKLNANRSGRTQNSPTLLFRRKIRCPQCGYKLAALYQKTYYSYMCNECYKEKRKFVNVSENVIYNAFVKHMKNEILTDFDTVPTNDHHKFKKRLKEIESERERVQVAFIKSLIDESLLTNHLKDLEKEENEIKEVLSSENIQLDDVVEVSRLFNEHFEELNREEKAMFVQRYIKEIRISRKLIEGYKRKYNTNVVSIDFY